MFEWSKRAIEIILEEIDSLKGKPAEEIFKEVGEDIKWPGYDDVAISEKLNWILTQVISSLNNTDEYRVMMPVSVQSICNNDLK